MEHEIKRTHCRKCGAILPGSVEVCPVCYADQIPKAKKPGYKIYLAIGFLAIIVIGLIWIISQA